MLRRLFCNVPNLFALMLCIQLVSSQLPPDQVSAMTRVYDIIQSDTGASYVWKNVSKYSNPCSWFGVNCSSDNSFIKKLTLHQFFISTSEFLPILCAVNTLQSLDVSNNLLTSIPAQFYIDCGTIRGLKLLNFSMNRLSGSLPTFNGFRELEILDFSRNSMVEEISLQLDGLGSLKSLNLSWNKFKGAIPTNLGKMNLLEDLRLSANYFTGQIPIAITKYRNLSVIDISGNELSGSIPSELRELTRLEILVLSMNNLSGRIPSSLSNIPTLKRFAANLNQFYGNIPSGITSYLGILDLSFNKLTGTIPVDLLSGPNLQSLDLSSNGLEGPIPAINSTRLFRLRLGSNSLNGTIPSESLESLGELMYLELNNNGLIGELPLGLGSCRKLVLLNLAQNNLTGWIPSIIGNLTNLQVLSLQLNNFVGVIPPEISQLNRLEKLNISRNSLNGSIPLSISSLSNLTNLDLQGNHLSGRMPDSIGSLPSLIELQLGSNQLSGRIPEMPQKLQIALNLSYNLFDGPIPATLSKLSVLEVLDLSNNRFEGEIPYFLRELRTLTYLLLSNNQLTGVVPKFGGHVTLVTKPGNDDLIIPQENPGPSTRGMKKSIVLVIIIAAAIGGILVGLMIVLVVSIQRRYNRIQCNRLTTSSIHRSNIDFKKAQEAVANPSNVTLKTRFSTYYKAVMPSGTSYFVKKVNQSNKIFELRSGEKFGEELKYLGMLSNSNVMIPVAYFMSAHSVYILYDFAPEGTLSNILHCGTLDWASRFSIAVGVSQGLSFLHEFDSSPLLLLDLSSNSILMKSQSEPQIGDIELSKLIRPSKSTGSISAVVGSPGYVPPEYAYTMRVTASGNIYSFGVVLLELLTGKPAVSGGTELAKWVLSSYAERNRWEEILDVSVSDISLSVKSQMLAVLEVALACISTAPETRPSVVNVLQMLLNTRS